MIVSWNLKWSSMITSPILENNTMYETLLLYWLSQPVSTWLGPGAFSSIDHQRKSTCFATTCGAEVLLWDLNKYGACLVCLTFRNNYTHKYEWGSDTATFLRFNPVETHVLATTLNDRSITLFDTRGRTALKKVFLAVCETTCSINCVDEIQLPFMEPSQSIQFCSCKRR